MTGPPGRRQVLAAQPPGRRVAKPRAARWRCSRSIRARADRAGACWATGPGSTSTRATAQVFIRSTAAGDRLGGLAPATRSAAAALAAAFDVVVIETVGVGQSEAEVADVADTVAVVVQPASGDVLQFLKAGIMEVPDVLVLTKADLGRAARRAIADLTAALTTLGAPDTDARARCRPSLPPPGSPSSSTRSTPTAPASTCPRAGCTPGAGTRSTSSSPSTASAGCARSAGGWRPSGGSPNRTPASTSPSLERALEARAQESERR